MVDKIKKVATGNAGGHQNVPTHAGGDREGRVRLSGRTLFISDLHLDESRPGDRRAIRALPRRGRPGRRRALHPGRPVRVLGGRRRARPALPRRASPRASRRPPRGVPICFMHGNRDFLVARAASRARPASQLIADPDRDRPLRHARRCCCTATRCAPTTRAYQAFRAQVRDPAWQRAALARPLAERLAIAQDMRAEERRRQAGQGDGDHGRRARGGGAGLRANRAATLMIHGHTHRPARHVHRVGGARARALGAARLVRARRLPRGFARGACAPSSAF